MLAAMAYNGNRMAEMLGDRRASVIYQCYSKAKGEKVTKIKKSPSSEEWKKSVAKKAVERNLETGQGAPADLDQEDLDEEIDIVINRFEELLDFDDSDVDENLDV
uniref:Uncharacterized protein n=1 Tax=Acrobeloides nanus TaxID=290746 RepID=A0A914EGQ3_9BILA